LGEEEEEEEESKLKGYLLTKINWNALRKVPSTGSLAKLSLATTEGLKTCTSLHAKQERNKK
jgi:hypothetical protein